jgi:hypothetical protein
LSIALGTGRRAGSAAHQQSPPSPQSKLAPQRAQLNRRRGEESIGCESIGQLCADGVLRATWIQRSWTIAAARDGVGLIAIRGRRLSGIARGGRYWFGSPPRKPAIFQPLASFT